MAVEHCSLAGFNNYFKTGKDRTTCPAVEWDISVNGNHALAVLRHSRELKKIEELMTLPVVEKSKLTRCEVIAVVLYTGPMVSLIQMLNVE